MHRIKQALHQVHSRIEKAKQYQVSRPVSLLAVSKKQSVDLIRAAYLAGQTDFGENYLQEALEKQPSLADLAICWHFIGPIQSNKTRAIAEHFDWVHSLDRLKIAQRLSQQRPAHLPALNVCLQINIDDEESKSGIHEKDALDFAKELTALKNLRLRGLMIIPKATTDPISLQTAFRKTRQLNQHLANALECELDTLSMGMSNDFELAIAEGATIVRIGTAIFGARR